MRLPSPPEMTTATTCYGLCESYHTVDLLRPAPSRSLHDALNARFWNFQPTHDEQANDSTQHVQQKGHTRQEEA